MCRLCDTRIKMVTVDNMNWNLSLKCNCALASTVKYSSWEILHNKRYYDAMQLQEMLKKDRQTFKILRFYAKYWNKP